jgi:hypothetical protein
MTTLTVPDPAGHPASDQRIIAATNPAPLPAWARDHLLHYAAVSYGSDACRERMARVVALDVPAFPREPIDEAEREAAGNANAPIGRLCWAGSDDRCWRFPHEDGDHIGCIHSGLRVLVVRRWGK